MTDFYDVLGVSKTATQQEIDKAYRSAARKYHPDKNPGNVDSANKFKEAAKAYEVIGDPHKREQHDRPPIHNMFENAFEHFFSARQRYAPTQINVSITLEEVFKGCQRTVEVTSKTSCTTCKATGASKWGTCSTCGGSGRIILQQSPFTLQVGCNACKGKGQTVQEVCADCTGKGYVGTTTKSLQVDIPPGIDDGMGIRMEGGGENGSDLHIIVNVQKHDVFERSQNRIDLIYVASVSYTQLVFGAEIDVPTFNAKVVVKIPPHSQSGKALRLEGLGLPNLGRSGHKGDIVAVLKLNVPQTISESHRAILDKLAEIETQEGLLYKS